MDNNFQAGTNGAGGNRNNAKRRFDMGKSVRDSHYYSFGYNRIEMGEVVKHLLFNMFGWLSVVCGLLFNIPYLQVPVHSTLDIGNQYVSLAVAVLGGLFLIIKILHGYENYRFRRIERIEKERQFNGSKPEK